MSPSAQPRPVKRLRLASPSAQLPTDVTMSDSPPTDPIGDMATSPSHQSGSIDAESLILEMTQTEAGAADLAKAIKTRRVRDVLKQHGVKIQADDDVGYNSLPRELRDNIRKCFIESFYPGKYPKSYYPKRECARCLRLAPFASIDSEWRDAIEFVTFQRLSLRETDEYTASDLELFGNYVVGRRRQYLRYIRLSVDTLQMIRHPASEQDKVGKFISPICQLFNCLKQWDESGIGNGNLHVHLQTTVYGLLADALSTPLALEHLHAALTNMPTTQQITCARVSLWQPIDARSLRVLLSRMPALRSVAVEMQTYRLPVNAQDLGSQIEVFFDSLPRTNPKIECLELQCDDAQETNMLEVKFCEAAFSYSQRLREFSLTNANMPVLRSILAPFSTAKFNSDAPPPLIWPNLTNFAIETVHYDGERTLNVTNHFMLKIGRAIRYMPRIQSLEVGLSYTHEEMQGAAFNNIHCSSEVLLQLEPPVSTRGHSPLATMYVTHESDPRLIEKVPSEDVVQLWQESLLHTANASLDIQMSFVTQEGKRVLNPASVREIQEL